MLKVGCVTEISSLSGKTSNSVGMARLAEQVRPVLAEPEKLDSKRHLCGFLFTMRYKQI